MATTSLISPFGAARPNTTGTHMGADYAAPIGTPIYTNVTGTVTAVTTNGNYGLRVEITDASGGRYQLAHLDSTNLQPGQTVTPGDLIAYSGNSGNAVTTPPHTHFEYRPADGGPGPYGTIDPSGKAGDFSYGQPGSSLSAYQGSVSRGQVAQGYTPQQGSAYTYNNITPDNVAGVDGGYKYYGSDEGGKYYVSADGKTSIQYDKDTNTWTKYNADTGEPLPSGEQTNLPSTPDSSNVPIASSGGTAPGATSAAGGPGGQAVGAAGAQVGGAGCLGGGLSPAQATAAAGIMGKLGGIAQSAAMGALTAALSGGGIQGIMGGALGGAAGAFGNALGGQLGGAGGAFLGQTLGGAVGAIAAGANPLQALSGSAFGALNSMGAGLIPGLSNVMPAPLAAAALNGLAGVLGGVATGQPLSASMRMGMAGGLAGLITNVTNNMTGNYALSSLTGAVAVGALNGQINLTKSTTGVVDTSRYAQLIQIAASVTSNNRTMVGAISEAMAGKFGNGVGGVGNATRNMQDAMTFSVSTLGQNINAVASDLINIGKWRSDNLMRLQQPGYVAVQILEKGLGDITGLTDLLLSANIPTAGLNNPFYDRITLVALAAINDPEKIALVKTAFDTKIEIKNLAELCDFTIMMPKSAGQMPVNNFRELGVQLAVIGITEAETLYDVGTAFSKIETSGDLNHMAQLAQPLSQQAGNNLMKIYGFGGGSLGEQTMADLIGTPAGYVHSDTIPVITKTNQYIMQHPEAARLLELTTYMDNLFKGKYTDQGTPDDDSAGPAVPGENGGIDIPTVGNFNTLDDAVKEMIVLVEEEQKKLLATTDPKLKDAIDKLNVAWEASCAQIVRENNNIITHDIDLFNPLPNTPQMAVMFAQSLDQYGLETGYGQVGDYLERVATDDVYGDAIKYSMRQARNAQALESLGVNVEKYKLPQSQYYRDPEGFYERLYSGNMPARPEMQAAIMFPRNVEDVYLYERNKKLDEMGYDNTVELLNNQKDEIYYDSTWEDMDLSVREGIGQTVLRNVINKNFKIDLPSVYVKDLNGVNFKFAEIKADGLLLLDNENFIGIMMALMNRALYGDLITTKFTNPFNTDQMVFGLLELFAQVNYQNINALLQTLTGGIIAGDFLSQLKTIYQAAADGRIPSINPADFNQADLRRSIFDTSMDRNEPAAWGDAGPPTTQKPRTQR